MQQLQAAGVAAGVVQDACDILERDLQLRARGAFVPLDHPRLGAFQHQASPHHLSRTPSAIEPAPLLGEHSERACCELFGLDARRYAELREAGLFV
jgi:benzylsuccinate CoA-transferase BbsF subunit